MWGHHSSDLESCRPGVVMKTLFWQRCPWQMICHRKWKKMKSASGFSHFSPFVTFHAFHIIRRALRKLDLWFLLFSFSNLLIHLHSKIIFRQWEWLWPLLTSNMEKPWVKWECWEKTIKKWLRSTELHEFTIIFREKYTVRGQNNGQSFSRAGQWKPPFKFC